MPDNDYSDTKQNDVNKSTISNIQIDAPPNQQEANPKFYKHKKSIYREMSSFEKIMVWLTALRFVVATASIIALVCSINNADRN
ncbi:MAG TPA: hypothetical protein PLK94_08570, partial [Alphaproteobacteria bacterium]|nr:hypothetical protein [Alphaproteobacteria bacterium]